MKTIAIFVLSVAIFNHGFSSINLFKQALDNNNAKLPMVYEVCFNCDKHIKINEIYEKARKSRANGRGGKSQPESISIVANLYDGIVHIHLRDDEDFQSPLDSTLQPFDFKGNLAGFKRMLMESSNIDGYAHFGYGRVVGAANEEKLELPENFEIDIKINKSKTLRQVLIQVAKDYNLNISAIYKRPRVGGDDSETSESESVVKRVEPYAMDPLVVTAGNSQLSLSFSVNENIGEKSASGFINEIANLIEIEIVP